MDWKQMTLDESRRHRTKQQLLKCLSHLRQANRGLYLAEDHAEFFRIYSDTTQSIYDNLHALRQGITETQEIIANEIARIERTMLEPTAEVAPIRGAHLSDKRTPRQRQLGIQIDTLPKTFKPKKPYQVPEVIPHPPYRPRERKRPTTVRQYKKQGKIVI